MQEDLTRVSLIELMSNLKLLDNQIKLLTLKQEKIKLELTRRFPTLQDVEEFKPKEEMGGYYKSSN